MDKRYIHKQGNVIWAIHSNASLICDRERRSPLFVSQIQDIKPIAIPREPHPTEFISVVARTPPMTAIRGSLGYSSTRQVRPSSPNEISNHILHTALKTSDRLIQLINDILDLERLESAPIKLVKETLLRPPNCCTRR